MGLSFIYPDALWLLLLLPAVAALGFLGRQRLSARRRWTSLLLRLLLLTFLILALAGTQIVRQVDELTTVFLVDASDSVSAEERARAEAFIREAVQFMRPGDKVAIVVFGENALVEQLPTEDLRWHSIASIPTVTRTNIAQAIQLGLALFPEDAEKRMVLLSDGQENIGQARKQAEMAAAREVQIDVVPLSPPIGDTEVIFAGLHAPSGVRVGQRFELTAVIASTVRTTGVLRIFGDNQLLAERQVQITPGLNRFAVPLTAAEQGFRRYHAQIETAADSRPQNNQMATFTIIHGPPRILIVADKPADATALYEALTVASLNPEQISPTALPTDLATLAGYDAIVLVNTPADRLSPTAMETLAAFVRDLGHGLIMVGGDRAYGAGGYLRTPLEQALPVDMDVRSRTRDPNVALVMAVDKSGSMGRCHCDDPRGPSTRAEVGIPKVDIAKQAMLEASTVLGRLDYLGVIAFDEKARWALETQPLVNLDVLESAIAGIGADGGTNIRAGLDQAFTNLKNVDARIKHVILITDGWTNAGGYDALVQEMHEQGITLSIVAAGRGSAEYLEKLAEEGGGKYYPVTTMDEIPRIFLKETIRAVGSYIIEQPFHPMLSQPSPILTGLGPASLPPLYGYNGTTPKDAATVALVSPEGDPILAHWQYGLGRAVAWTSDLTGRWAADWVNWPGFPTFAAQLVSWALPAPQSETIATEIRLDGNRALISVEAFDEIGRPRDLLDTTARIIAPDLTTTEVKLQQTAAGHYEGVLTVSQVGPYLVQVQQSDDDTPITSQTTGFVVPYSPEYTSLTIDTQLLTEVAQETGGRVDVQPADAFAHTLEAVQRSQPVWTWLLLMAALLFPFDVAIRRVMINWQEIVEMGTAWLGRRSGEPAPEEGEPLLEQLFAAKKRVTPGRAPTESAPPVVPSTPASSTPQPPAAAESAPAASAPQAAERKEDTEEAGDTLERLRKAKERVRRSGS